MRVLLSRGRAGPASLGSLSFERNIPLNRRPVGKLCETWAQMFLAGGGRFLTEVARVRLPPSLFIRDLIGRQLTDVN